MKLINMNQNSVEPGAGLSKVFTTLTVSHCLPCNSSHNVVNHAIGIMEASTNVNIVAKLLAKLQEVESSCRCTYNGVGGVIT